MSNTLRSTLRATTFAAACLSATLAFGQSEVIATVGSVEITEAELAAAQKEIGQQFAQIPEEQRRLAVLSALIDIKALATEAKAENLGEDPAVSAEIDFLSDRTLHNAYFRKHGVDAVTDEEIRARYEEEIATIAPSEEIRARHILLKTREEAEAVIAELDGGADFAEQASQKSTGPTGPNGGDLGFFSAGQMVPPFEEAAMALEPGSYTEEPVETQFGWHVIKVEEKRQAAPPAFEDVEAQVRNVVLQQKYMELVGEARDALKVTYVDPELKAQVDGIEEQLLVDPAADDAAPADAAPADAPQ